MGLYWLHNKRVAPDLKEMTCSWLLTLSNNACTYIAGLKELHISSLYGSITDATILKALRHMPLHKLRLYSQSVSKYEAAFVLMVLE